MLYFKLCLAKSTSYHLKFNNFFFQKERDRREYERDRNRDRYGRYDKKYSGNDRNRYNDEPTSSRKRKEERSDKFMGSLSEGQRPDKESSSGSEIADIDIDDEDDEEKIIQMRRKKREELLKVKLLFCILQKCVSSQNNFDLFDFNLEIVGCIKGKLTEKVRREFQR